MKDTMDNRREIGKTFRAEVVRLSYAYKIPLRNLEVSQKTFDWGTSLGVAFHVFSPAYLYQEVGEVYEHPATWWDALKAAWPPFRWLGLCPHMKTVPVAIKQYRMCPHLEVQKEHRHYTWMAYGEGP